MKNPCLNEMTYGEFAEELNKKIISSRIPVSATLELTYRCNLQCVHCYCNQPQYDKGLQARELGFSDYKQILDQIADRGCLWLLFTGGEPLLHQDFKQIYLYARQKGFLITIFTNATLIDADTADFFKAYPPTKMEVTIYGADSETFENITRGKGSFAACLQAIKRLKQRKISLDAKTIVLRENQHQFELIEKLTQALDMGFRFDFIIQPRLNGAHEPYDHRISPFQGVKLDLADEQRKQNWLRYKNDYSLSPATKKLFCCGAGETLFSLDPYGNLGVCSQVTAPVFNIKEYDFNKIWDDLFPQVIKKEYEQDSDCIGCKLAVYCQQCPGWGIIENGDPETINDYVCQVAHERAARLEEEDDEKEKAI